MLNSLLYITLLIMISVSSLTINSFAQWTIPNLDSLNKENTTTFSTYESNDSTLKIDYPSDWTLLENTPNEIEFHPQASESRELVQLRITPLASQSRTFSITGFKYGTKCPKYSNAQASLFLYKF